MGLHIILGYAFAVVVHNPKVGLGLGMSLLSRLAVPLRCLGIILQAFDEVVYEPKVELGLSIDLNSVVSRKILCFGSILIIA